MSFYLSTLTCSKMKSLNIMNDPFLLWKRNHFSWKPFILATQLPKHKILVVIYPVYELLQILYYHHTQFHYKATIFLPIDWCLKRYYHLHLYVFHVPEAKKSFLADRLTKGWCHREANLTAHLESTWLAYQQT